MEASPAAASEAVPDNVRPRGRSWSHLLLIMAPVPVGGGFGGKANRCLRRFVGGLALR